MADKLVVLMATYNGEKYLQEQIDSIMNQNFKNLFLVIRDDGSSDNTISIIKKNIKRYASRITLIENHGYKHGAKNNFFELSKYALDNKYDYFMFSDQDDVWKANKVDICLEKIKKSKDQNRPRMVHTDLEVVDSQLHTLANSFSQYSALNASIKDINHLLIQNNVTGCTILGNRALLKMALRVNNIDNVVMHDWWFSLVCSLFGEIIYLPESTILYRQHGNNVVGAKGMNIKGIIAKAQNLSLARQSLLDTIKQSELLYSTYRNSNDAALKLQLVKDYSLIKNLNKVQRVIFLLKSRILKQNKASCIGELILI